MIKAFLLLSSNGQPIKCIEALEKVDSKKDGYFNYPNLDRISARLD